MGNMQIRFIVTVFIVVLVMGCGNGKPERTLLPPPPSPGTSPLSVIAAGSPSGCAASSVIVSVQVGVCSSSPTPGSNPGQTTAPGQTVAPNGEIDWPTFGFDAARSGDNASEKTLTSATVNRLHELWSYKLGGSIEASPVFAAGVHVGAGLADVVYVGNQLGFFAAVNAQTGTAIWTKQLGAQQSTCNDTPGDIFGVGSTARIDRTRNRVYVTDGKGILWALDLGTGAVSAGWPAGGTQVVTNPALDHVRSALNLNATGSTVYAETAAFCDLGRWSGAIRSIDTGSGQVTQTFYFATNSAAPPGAQGNFGGSIWGWGGAAIDPDTQNIYAATGNIGPGEQALNSDSIIEWNPGSLTAPLASYEPPNPTGMGDDDFGASVTLYDDGGQCLAVGRKDGFFYVFDRTNIAQGAKTHITMGPGFATAAHSSATHMIYFSPANDFPGFPHGLYAFQTGPNCTLNATPAWQESMQSFNTAGRHTAPIVAADVVYEGINSTLAAYNAASGAALWTSGTSIAGSIWAEPIVVNGRAYVAERQGNLYAFGL